MRALRWFGVLLFLVAAGLAFSNWQTAERLRAENTALRAEVQALHDQSALASADVERKLEAELQRSRKESQELLRLRGEVTQLRSSSKEGETLRAENQRLAAENQQWRASVNAARVEAGAPAAGRDQFSKADWAFAGYASPEAALVSAIWSMKEGNPKSYLESLAPEEQARMAKVWENQTEAEIAAKHQSDVSAISAFRIMERQNVSDNAVLLNVYIDGVGRMEKVAMKRVGNEWKFGGFVRPPPQ
jgi:hypothetical protein